MIKFSKMHGLGNDFIVIDGISQKLSINQIPIQKLADRHIGIGCDQLLVIEPSRVADFACRIFNSDGSEAEQCGNGMRCIGRFISEKKLSNDKSFTVETKEGIATISIQDFEHIQVNMGIPHLEGIKEIKLAQQIFHVDVLSIGNPHAILTVQSVKSFPVTEVGSQISTHTSFPRGINVGFMEVIDSSHIKLRTFERGAGETYACGSNACAATIVGIQNKLLDKKVKVEVALGNLWVEWAGKDKPVLMTGPAEYVFEGIIQS